MVAQYQLRTARFCWSVVVEEERHDAGGGVMVFRRLTCGLVVHGNAQYKHEKKAVP